MKDRQTRANRKRRLISSIRKANRDNAVHKGIWLRKILTITLVSACMLAIQLSKAESQSGHAHFDPPQGCIANPLLKITQNCVIPFSPTHEITITLTDERYRRTADGDSVDEAAARRLALNHLAEIQENNSAEDGIEVIASNWGELKPQFRLAQADFCLAFGMSVMDTRVPGHEGVLFIIVAWGRVCARIMLDSQAIQIATLVVSERYSGLGDEPNPDFKEIADSVFASLRLE